MSFSDLEDPTGRHHPVHGSASGGEVTSSEEPSSVPQQRKATGGSSAADLRAQSQREAGGSGASDLRALRMSVEQMQRSMAEMQAAMAAMASGQTEMAPPQRPGPTEAGSGSGETTAVRGPSEQPLPQGGLPEGGPTPADNAAGDLSLLVEQMMA